jgi:hypothetical protein
MFKIFILLIIHIPTLVILRVIDQIFVLNIASNQPSSYECSKFELRRQYNYQNKAPGEGSGSNMCEDSFSHNYITIAHSFNAFLFKKD